MNRVEAFFKEKAEGAFDYFVFVDGGFRVINSIALLRHLHEFEEVYGRLWSARMTGILGKYDCGSGNRGPKNKNEVILAFGNEGLAKLVELGFVPCPSCHPEETPGFWQNVSIPVKLKYGFGDPHDFVDRSILPFDARRIVWEDLPVDKPSRLYLPKGLTVEDLLQLRDRLDDMGWTLPEVGYYQKGAPGNFVRYEVE